MSAELPVISLVPHPVNATGVAKDAWTRPSMDDVTWQTLRIPRQRGKRAECPRALLDTRADP